MTNKTTTKHYLINKTNKNEKSIYFTDTSPYDWGGVTCGLQRPTISKSYAWL